MPLKLVIINSFNVTSQYEESIRAKTTDIKKSKYSPLAEFLNAKPVKKMQKLPIDKFKFISHTANNQERRN